MLSPGEKLNSRILVVSGSSESTAQYMSFMNVFFTAQKTVMNSKKILKSFLHIFYYIVSYI